MIGQAKIGNRARFVGKDHVFSPRTREGKVGTIVTDANLDPRGSNFGGGTCGWKLEGYDGLFITDLADLELVSDTAQRLVH